MSTWRIFSDSGNSFRWEISDRHPQNGQFDDRRIEETNSTSRLPSKADVLFQGQGQGCSELLEEDGESVDVNETTLSTGQVFCGDEKGSNSLFQTASGKKVNISSASLVRAKTLLLGLEDNNYDPFQSLQRKKNNNKVEEPSVVNQQFGWHSSSHSSDMDAISVSKSMTNDLGNNALTKHPISVVTQSGKRNSDLQPPPTPIKFHTSGGRSISVSSNALQRARSLLGDPDLDEVDVESSLFQAAKPVDKCSNKENNPFAYLSHDKMANGKHGSQHFVSPLQSSDDQMRLLVKSENTHSGARLIKKFDAVGFDTVCWSNSKASCPPKAISNSPEPPHYMREKSPLNGTGQGTNCFGRSFHGPLVDISNSTETGHTDEKQATGGKKRLGRTHFTSPFKRPRSSRFCAPLNKNVSSVPSGLSTTISENSCSRRMISTRYPFPVPRIYIKEYFGVPPFQHHMLGHLADKVRWIIPDNAQNYMFTDGSGSACIGVDAFANMLALSGASKQHASKEWVANHYKWIVWKLACYDRCYPAKSAGNFLSVFNVLEELKYRYEREVNHGHRSAIKRVFEGDTSPSSMMVLCVSAIHSNNDKDQVSNGPQNSNKAKVELTDGWYSMEAILDVPLSKQLTEGKLYVGQKLRVWGAELCGRVGPLSSLEAPNALSMLLHMNGTYRAHWAERLGLCKGVAAPLAFRCIKSAGGPVPQTLVGVTRIYPVLYKERLNGGGTVVRSEKMEAKMMQLFNQRRSIIVEGITSELERSTKDLHACNDSDSEEGAKILKILETAAEPEVIMAEMSAEQLASIATYQAKMEARRHLDIQKSIEKALEDAGLSKREVTPFMRVKVVGLSTKSGQGKKCQKEGLITLWEPTEKQCLELVEGQSYAITGLTPSTYNSDVLFLQARGCTTRWQPLSPSASKQFEPFYSHRISVLLSNLDEVSLSSEFDIAALIVHVGEIYKDAHQKKQWVFVTDGSLSELHSREFSNSLLAICFCSPDIDDDSFPPINNNLTGATVGFCNIIKREKDQVNQIWVAEATENTIFVLNYDLPHCSHLKNAAASVQRWATISSSIIERLREKVLSVVDNPTI